MASRGSKIALASTSLFAVSTIVLVHFQQKAEQSVRTLWTPTWHMFVTGK